MSSAVAGRKDLIKAGSGKGQLFGQAGNDNLRGQGGADKINGGAGRDLCNGGRDKTPPRIARGSSCFRKDRRFNGPAPGAIRGPVRTQEV
jgi:hypothetical protein